jgi:hypothetical protein
MDDYFGHLNPRQFLRWWGGVGGVLRVMEEYGLEVGLYEAEDVLVGRSQCAFDMGTATLVKTAQTRLELEGILNEY